MSSLSDASTSNFATPSQTSSMNAPIATPGDVGNSLLTSVIGDNPYFQAGFGLMGVGVALGGLRKGISLGALAIQRRLLVSLEIHNRDRGYDWFLKWMASQSKSQAASRTQRWIKSHQLSLATVPHSDINGSSGVSFDLVAGPGIHWFKYQGAWMQIKRERETRSLMAGMPWETVILTTLSKDRHLFAKLMNEARNSAMRDQEGRIVIYTAWGTDWRPFGKPRTKRLLQSVVLDDDIAERIEGDVLKFLGRRKWYAERGIPYRRGYLLYGPPGSGKTSFIQALAGSLGYNICLLNLSERGLADDKFNHLLSNIPERSIVLIEDVDAAFNKRVQTSEDGYQSSVTFSGFLNALDGVASGEERILFMTTNHLERLDPALIRPGRVDVLELIGDASPTQAKRLLTRFYSADVDPEELENMGRVLERMMQERISEGNRVSMAALQGLFIRSGATEVLERCRELLAEPTRIV